MTQSETGEPAPIQSGSSNHGSHRTDLGASSEYCGEPLKRLGAMGMAGGTFLFR